MSTGPIGIAGSAAGVPSATRGGDAEKVKADRADQSARAERERFAARREETVDETDLGHIQVSDRDADGRLPDPPARRANDDAEADEDPAAPSSADADGESGSNLDVLA